MGDQRGQSPVLGIVLLVGFVVVAVSALLIVGSTALSSVQDQSEREHDLNEMQSVSHEIENAIQSSDSGSSMEVQNGYRVSDGATVTIWVDGEKAVDEEIRRLERNGFVYEGSMILEDGNVVSAPNFDLGIDSTKLQIPTVESSTGSFGGEIRHTGTQTIDSPEERLEIKIESEYYEQWATAFEESNADRVETTGNAVIVEFNFEPEIGNIEQALQVGMDDGSSFNLNDLPNVHIESYDDGTVDPVNPGHEAVVETEADGGNVGGKLVINGDMRFGSEDTINTDTSNVDISGDALGDQDISVSTPTDELLVNAVGQEYKSGENLEGRVYVSDDLTLDSDITVEEESILIVNGDLSLVDSEILVSDAVDIHIHGSLNLEGETTIQTTDPHRGDQVSIFVGDDIDVTGQHEITGLVHGTDATLDILEGEAIDVYGAMVIDTLSGDSNPGNPDKAGHFTLYYDENLGGELPYATSNVRGSVLAGFFSEYTGDVHDGDYNDEGDRNDNLLVTGAATVTHSELEGDFLVQRGADIEATNIGRDLIVMNDLDINGGSVGGDLWVNGNLNSTGSDVNIHNDLYVNGDVYLESATVDGNVYVVGNLEINGDPNLNGEVHVLGDLLFDGEPIDANTYVDGDVEIHNHVNEDLHASGDIECVSGNINGKLHTGDDYDGSCGTADSQGDPQAPDIPTKLLRGPLLFDWQEDTTHHFDIRIATIEIK